MKITIWGIDHICFKSENISQIKFQESILKSSKNKIRELHCNERWLKMALKKKKKIFQSI